jgi:hypothetical protein
LRCLILDPRHALDASAFVGFLAQRLAQRFLIESGNLAGAAGIQRRLTLVGAAA